jgi:hypothetical protein
LKRFHEIDHEPRRAAAVDHAMVIR